MTLRRCPVCERETEHAHVPPLLPGTAWIWCCLDPQHQDRERELLRRELLWSDEAAEEDA